MGAPPDGARVKAGSGGSGGPARGPVRAVLFDLDGVLIDSYEAWFAVVNGTSRELGFGDVPRERFRAIFGQGIAADVVNLYPGRAVAEVEAAYERRMRAQHGAIEVNPEARTTLAALRSRGVRVACVTNTHAGLADALLHAAGLVGAFDDVEAAGGTLREKPAPDLLLAALAALAVPAGAALMVGDSRYDEEAAAAARVPFLAYVMRSAASLRAAVDAALAAATPAR